MLLVFVLHGSFTFVRSIKSWSYLVLALLIFRFEVFSTQSFISWSNMFLGFIQDSGRKRVNESKFREMRKGEVNVGEQKYRRLKRSASVHTVDNTCIRTK